jgi:choline/glycine/proline betaine transport protein
MVWMGVLGNSAIELVLNGDADELARQAIERPGASIYLFLETLPWPLVTTMAVSLLALVFFVTSGDSGSLVLSNLTLDARDAERDPPSWMRVMWAAIIGLLTLALLFADGLDALQGTVVIMGLPFSIVLCLMMWGLYRALQEER